MAPDRGPSEPLPSAAPETNTAPPMPDGDHTSAAEEASATQRRRRSDAGRFLATRAAEGQNFTVRGVLVGLGVGVLICFSNMYFGLQTGWVSSMAMPASLIGFAFFKTLARHLALPFTPVENVLVQTVAGAVGTMPLGSGFVGVVPAIEFLLAPSEHGPLKLSLARLVLWSLGLCFFGVFFAVPLRKEVIIREKLKFPSGTATALMIGVLHGGHVKNDVQQTGEPEEDRLLAEADSAGQDVPPPLTSDEADQQGDDGLGMDSRSDWRSKVRLLVISFVISGFYVSDGIDRQLQFND